MKLTRCEVAEIASIMELFPDAMCFELTSESCGIGCTTTLSVATTVGDREATVSFEITGPKDW
jgi:hypothetical protein